MRFIGDTHIKDMDELMKYYQLTDGCEESIHVGDFSIRQDVWSNLGVSDKHKILGGNHEFYPSYHQHANSLGDWGTTPGNRNIFFCRGADSIDKDQRKDGYEWFQDEELSILQCNHAIAEYAAEDCSYMVSHDCPQQVVEFVKNIPDVSRTRSMLDAMFDIHQPLIWVFGHHHVTRNFMFRNCNFICLAPWEIIDIKL